MFVVTVINFLISSLNAGTQIAGFIVYIRTALILDIAYPLSEKRELVNNASQNLTISQILVREHSGEYQSVATGFRVSSYSAKILFSDVIVVWRAWVLF